MFARKLQQATHQDQVLSATRTASASCSAGCTARAYSSTPTDCAALSNPYTLGLCMIMVGLSQCLGQVFINRSMWLDTRVPRERIGAHIVLTSMLRQVPRIVPRALQGPTPTRLVRDDTSRAAHRLSMHGLSQLQATMRDMLHASLCVSAVIGHRDAASKTSISA